jgi:hypothetical protein
MWARLPSKGGSDVNDLNSNLPPILNKVGMSKRELNVSQDVISSSKPKNREIS